MTALRRVGSGACAALILLVIATSCASKFDGPYPCLAGFASCASQDGCETNLGEDATNCGACGTACPLGDVCRTSACQPGATVFEKVTSGTPLDLAVNASGVFWLTGPGSAIETAAATGGAPSAVDVNASVFAVDDTNLYFAGFATNGNGGDGVWTVPIAGGAPSELAPLNSTGASLLLVEGGSVFWAGASMGTQSEPVSRIATTGGAVSRIADLTNIAAGQIVADAHNLYAVLTNNGPCIIQSVPIAGGDPVTIASPENGCPSAIATDGTSVYWVGTLEMQQQNNNSGNPQAPSCVLTVQAVPVAGGTPSTLASFSTYELPTSIAVDGVNVYFSTYQNVRKVPLGGGAVVPIAGAFGAPAITPTSSSGQGGNAYQCGNSSSGSSNVMTISLALGPSDVYVADGFNGDILKAPK